MTRLRTTPFLKSEFSEVSTRITAHPARTRRPGARQLADPTWVVAKRTVVVVLDAPFDAFHVVAPEGSGSHTINY